MTVDQIVLLIGHVAWPVVAIVGLLLLPFYMTYITKSMAYVADLTTLTTEARKLLQETDKVAELKEKFDQLKLTLAPLQLQISELKALQSSLLKTPMADSASSPNTAQNIDAWVETVRTEWEKAKTAIRRIASRSGIKDVDLSAIGASTSAVQTIGDRLLERKVIDAETANLMTDLSTRFHLWIRSPNRAAYMNADGVSDFTSKAASLVETLSNARHS